MGKPEGKITKALKVRCAAAGAELRKVKWEGRKGCPDYFVMLKGGNTLNFWAECKRGDGRGRLEVLQEREIARMRELGEIVYVFDSEDQINRALPL